MKLTKEDFGVTPDGAIVDLFTLTNDQGMEVRITNYGGVVTAIKVPDRNGRFDDVVLGHDNLEGYLHRSKYFGALIGRYANRIEGGRFSLDGVAYSLTQNNGLNHLHGGFKGFDKVVWTANEVSTSDELRLQLSYISRDGEEGYPGNLQAKVTYLLNEQNELRLEYVATTDEATILNLTNHSYFNLAGTGTILNHELMIEADAFTPVREGLTPTGEIRSVINTPMDFSVSTPIGACINDNDEQVKFAGGYDHNFILRTVPSSLRRDGSLSQDDLLSREDLLNREGSLNRAARLYDAGTGRVLEVFTTQPGLQFYSGNFLDGSIVGKSGRRLVKHSGCCLETQHFPDSPNHPNFPSTALEPGHEYQQTTVFKFSVN